MSRRGMPAVVIVDRVKRSAKIDDPGSWAMGELSVTDTRRAARRTGNSVRETRRMKGPNRCRKGFRERRCRDMDNRQAWRY